MRSNLPMAAPLTGKIHPPNSTKNWANRGGGANGCSSDGIDCHLTVWSIMRSFNSLVSYEVN